MKKIFYIIASLVLIALVIIRLKDNKEIVQERVYHYDKKEAISVHTVSLKLENIEANYLFTGNFQANKEVKLSAELQGKIVSVYAQEGDFVKKGQVLLKVDAALLELQVEAVQVQIEGLEADIKRYTILTNADAIQGVKLEKTQFALRAAQIQKNILLEKVNKTTVKAPFSGVITMKFTEEGAFAAPAIPLFQITDISKLKFTINVSENDLALFQLNKSYKIKSDAYPNLELSAKVSMIGSKTNRAKNYSVQFTVRNTSAMKIKAGMFGKLILEGNGAENQKSIVIPTSAIVGSTVQPQVYLVKNNKAILQNISISKRIQNKAVVIKGLKEDDLIVIAGFINLFDGANILIK